MCFYTWGEIELGFSYVLCKLCSAPSIPPASILDLKSYFCLAIEPLFPSCHRRRLILYKKRQAVITASTPSLADQRREKIPVLCDILHSLRTTLNKSTPSLSYTYNLLPRMPQTNEPLCLNLSAASGQTWFAGVVSSLLCVLSAALLSPGMSIERYLDSKQEIPL